jgi:hypothetical protein
MNLFGFHPSAGARSEVSHGENNPKAGQDEGQP